MARSAFTTDYMLRCHEFNKRLTDNIIALGLTKEDACECLAAYLATLCASLEIDPFVFVREADEARKSAVTERPD